MNILLTCAGRRNYIVEYFQTELRKIGGKVYAANSSPDSTALIVADKGLLVPSLYAPDYIDTLINICEHYEIEAIIPLFDLELPILANAKSRLSDHGIIAIVSSPGVVDICNDKWHTHQFLNEHGIKTPRTFLDLQTAMIALQDGQMSFPLIVKPRWGMGSIGINEVENLEELTVLFNRTLRFIRKSYLSNESNADISKAVMIQEKLNGQEFGLDVINDLEGHYITTIIKKKIAMRSGETDGAMVVDSPELAVLGERISKHLGHVANLDLDVFLTDQGLFVLEMNPRFGGGYPFSHLAGANLPAAILSWLQGKEADPACFRAEFGVSGYKGILPLRTKENIKDYRDL